MRKIREILRLKWVAQRSHREAARSLGVSPGAVASTIGRAHARALTWEAVEALSDDALERTLYGPTPAEVDGIRSHRALVCAGIASSASCRSRRHGCTLRANMDRGARFGSTHANCSNYVMPDR